MSRDKRVLLATTYVSKGEGFEFLGKGRYVMPMPRTLSYGLRFIKQNVPEVEILEFPTWEEYCKKLKEGWDVVGFSFLGLDSPRILEMVDRARESGVGEIWGGNYGILTESIQPYFDRVFIGYSESEIAGFFGRKIQRIIHPPLIEYFASPLKLKISRRGVLFTSRGCGRRCKFCQIPVFCPKPCKIPIESIRQVLRYYKDLRIKNVLIADDNFGVFGNYTGEIVSLLDEHGFSWTAMVNLDVLSRKLEEWRERGLTGAIVGIESLSQRKLDGVGKKQKVEEVLEQLKFFKSLLGFYIIGFENDTVESIKAEIMELKKLDLACIRLWILTPVPQTPLWDYIVDKYGIFESDFRKFDGNHLVWNHPNIKPAEMEKLLAWGLKELNFKGFSGFFGRLKIFLLHLSDFRSFKEFCLTNSFDYSQKIFFSTED